MLTIIRRKETELTRQRVNLGRRTKGTVVATQLTLTRQGWLGRHLVIHVPQSICFWTFQFRREPCLAFTRSWQGKVLTKRHLQSVYQSELIRQTFTKSWQFNTRREGRELTRPGQLGKHTKRPLIGPPDLGLSTLTPLSSDIRSLSFLSDPYPLHTCSCLYVLPSLNVGFNSIDLPSFFSSNLCVLLLSKYQWSHTNHCAEGLAWSLII